MKKNDIAKFKFDYFPKEILKHWESSDHKIDYVNVYARERKEYKTNDLMTYSFSHLQKDKMAFLLIDTNMKDTAEPEFIKIVKQVKKSIQEKTQNNIKSEELNKIREFVFASFLRQSLDNPDINHVDYEFVPSGVQMVAQFYKISPVSRNIEPIWNAIIEFFKKMNFIGFKHFSFDIPLVNPPVIKSNWKENKGEFLMMPFDKNFVVILSSIPIDDTVMPTEQEWNGFLTHLIMKDQRIMGYIPTQHFEIKMEEIKKLTKKEEIDIAMKTFKDQMELNIKAQKELEDLHNKNHEEKK